MSATADCKSAMLTLFSAFSSSKEVDSTCSFDNTIVIGFQAGIEANTVSGQFPLNLFEEALFKTL
jgi:hypothetical protein